jgi:hypothetical protein
MNPNELRLEELNAEQEAIKALIAKAKADIAQAKADEMKSNMPSVEEGMKYTRGLEGNRGEDGSLITKKQMAIPANSHEMPDGTIMLNSDMEQETAEVELVDIQTALSNIVTKSTGSWDAFRDRLSIGNAAKSAGMSREEFVMSQEFQEMFGNKYDKIAPLLEVPVIGDDSNLEGQALEDALDQKMQDDVYNMDINVRKDSESAKMREGSTGKQDRATPMKDETTPRSMGMTQDEGGTSSVNQKDEFWKTREGYDKAMEMYGDKPAWVKEPTMIFNPETQEYEKIKEEDKEQFEDLGISADIKRMFG